MWSLENQTAYAAERNWTRDKHGVHHWIVAVKATFEIGPDGRLKLSDVQVPPILAPEYHGEPGASSLRFDSDLLAIKHCTDVVLDANAHVPGGKRSTSVVVSLRVADVRKSLVVSGDRVYYTAPTGGLTMSTPQPFATRAIRYERAFGGADTSDRDPSRHSRDPRNPIGVGFSLEPSRLVHKPAPSVEHTGGDPNKNGPAGYGHRQRLAAASCFRRHLRRDLGAQQEAARARRLQRAVRGERAGGSTASEPPSRR
jgi:hypothetical protein